MRGRSNNGNSNNNNRGNRGPNPLTRSYESNGPDMKVRGTAQNVAEKYAQLARDAQASGDRVMAENYLQHAEHYYRIIITAQALLAPQNASSPNESDADEGDDNEDMPYSDVQILAPPQREPRPQQEHRSYEPRNNESRNNEPRHSEPRNNEQRPSRFEGQENRHQERNLDTRTSDQRPSEGRSFEGRSHEYRGRSRPQERPEFGDQPSVEFPLRPATHTNEGERAERPMRSESAVRTERPPRFARPERAARDDRQPREERPARSNQPDLEAAPSEQSTGFEPAEPTGAENNLPSFLTRGRRRPRPAYRMDSEETTDSGTAPESSAPMID